MKKRQLFVVITMIVLSLFGGCKTTDSYDVPAASSQTAEEFTFADLSNYLFEFSSGAGGWSEKFTIEKDGYLTGKYHDSEMGDIGEGYADGTFYSCFYSGHFTDLVQVKDNTYRMTLSDITYKEEVGTEEIVDNVRYIYTESSCLRAGDTLLIYLPGTSKSELSEETWIWLKMANENEEELTVLSLVNERTGYGIYSYERVTPVEDAQMTYDSYKHSYDYFEELLSKAETTLEMVECLDKMYGYSDECLNYIWNLIRYNVAEADFDEILEEQREWITEKEAKAEEARKEYEGGTLAQVNYLSTLAKLTIERCEELIEYLKEEG